MPIKDKLASFLSGFHGREAMDEPLVIEREPPKQTIQTAPQAAPEDPALLDLPADHPIRYLRDLWYRESGHSSALQLRMGEDDVELPPEVIKKEKARLQSTLKSVCVSRWNTVRAMNPNRHGRKTEAKKAESQGSSSMDACVFLFISSDKLWAWILVLPPVGGGAELSRAMVDQALSSQGISYGLDTTLLERLPHDQERYFSLRLIARGKAAFDGANGNIVDRVPRSVERTLKVNEFGQVDYTSLNLIRNVQKGQEICCLIKPTSGEPGRTVLDQEIPAKSGANMHLPKGRNTEITEDGEALIASISGHVSFSGNSFHVKPVLDVGGDVDFSTGNIKFVGDVNVKGDVLSGFSVHAMGNVYVGGVVEAGASVEAGGDLTVVKGILGDGTTIIRSSGCVFSKYVENATIYVRENLQTDCVVNSKIYCDGDVVVRSGRGSIMGGQTWAAQKVSANIIGTRSEIKTSIALGGRPCASLDLDLARQELQELSQELDRLEEQPDNPAKSVLIGKARMKRSVASLKLAWLEEDTAARKASRSKEQESGRMECGVAYAGTEISIGQEFLRLRHDAHQCIAKLFYGEITLT